MKAKLQISQAQIEAAILQYFKSMDASEVTLRATELRSWNDQPMGGHSISAEVTIDVGNVVAH